MADDMNEKEDDFLNSKENDSEPVGNPAPPSDVDLDLLRGDRIGDTVYSGKWCIQTVMKMLKSNITVKPEEAEQQQAEDGKMDVVDMEEELQNEVGVLWDMTSNVEVCQYLQSVGAIESIYHVIDNSRCPRATEMCVGMLGNIVTHDELWQSLQSDTTLFAILIPLFSSTDQPVLLELSRFFTTAMSHSEIGHCYASMCSNGALVSQELVRILSGSTNCDLLKHTTELTHILMSVDKDDSHFNALFADPDFIGAVLEASKEIGYQQETTSQSCIMEILHGFTTFPAGISAMETCMGSITEAITKYLRSLCHNINLSNSGDTISIIITLLNHIFCRSLEVRIALMSSSKPLQNVLKILIALYRRLGLYDSIANVAREDHHHRQHRHHHHHNHHHQQHKKQSSIEGNDSKTSATASESWESSTNVEDDEEEEKSSTRDGKSEPKSWSERAGQGGETPKHIFATPDPSPKHYSHTMMKEVEFLSWSERRMASPLVDGALVAGGGEAAADDVWKIPQETRKMKKKTLSMEKVKDCDVTVVSLSKEEGAAGHGGLEIRKETEAQEESRFVCGANERDEGSAEGENMPKDSPTKLNSTSEETYEVKAVEMHEGRLSTDSHRSGGFSPSLENDDEEEEKDESMECENLPAGLKESVDGVDDGKDGRSESCAVSGSQSSEMERLQQTTSAMGVNQFGDSCSRDEIGPSSTMQLTNGVDDNDNVNNDNDGGDDDDEVLEDGTRRKVAEADGGLEGRDGEVNGGHAWSMAGARRERRPSHRSNLDKYNVLLTVVREFLSDFFNNLREGLLTEQGVPVISEIVSFLDRQCRPSTLRIVVHCVGPSQDLATPVGRLIHLSSCLNADNLHSVLKHCVGRKERQRI